MRSANEIGFRLRQELGNLAMLALPPALDRASNRPRGLPAVEPVLERLVGTALASEIEQHAEAICRHEFPLLGLTVKTGPEISWRRDPVSGVETGLPYFRRIPYLDPVRAGDHKAIWELNRHQHLVLLAQAFRLTGQARFLGEVAYQLEHWLRENPFLRGINWASALEVAFRSLSWLWIDHLAGARMDVTLRRQWLTALYRHGRYLEGNLSEYFSPNTHLLGEAVALHALGLAYPEWPGAARWREAGAATVRREIERQVREDGSHFEQSTYYHLYALDLFLFHAALEPPDTGYRDRLDRMARYLDTLVGPARRLPFLGDDDGGRVFHPYGERAGFCRATLATAAVLLGRRDLHYEPRDLHEQAGWWLGDCAFASAAPNPPAARVSVLFPDAGLAVMNTAETHIVVDAGPFGAASAGHSHSDTLSLVVSEGGREVLIDPGSFTYVAGPQWRERFRSSAAHNTVRVDGSDQARAAGPFRWQAAPETHILRWSASEEQDFLEAFWRSGGVRHLRSILFRKPNLICLHDEIEGPAGEHLVEQYWHPAAAVTPLAPCLFRLGSTIRLLLAKLGETDVSHDGEFGWRSPVFGAKESASLICWRRRGVLPMGFASVLDLSGKACRVEYDGGPPAHWRVSLDDGSVLDLTKDASSRGGPIPEPPQTAAPLDPSRSAR